MSQRGRSLVSDTLLELDEVGVVVDDEPTEVRQLVDLQLLDPVPRKRFTDPIEHLLPAENQVRFGTPTVPARTPRACPVDASPDPAVPDVGGKPDRVISLPVLVSFGDPTAPPVDLAAELPWLSITLARHLYSTRHTFGCWVSSTIERLQPTPS